MPESYLRGLERQVNLNRHAVPVVDDNSSQEAGGGGSNASATTARESPQQQPLPASPQAAVVDGPSSSLEDCSAEGFVRRLRELSLAPDSGGSGGSGSGIGSGSGSSHLSSHQARHSANHNAPSYTYSRLNFDVIRESLLTPTIPFPYHIMGCAKGMIDDLPY